MIEIDNATLDTIIEAKKNNKLAFFIGAGFSKNSETDLKKIPLWSDLINDLKKSLGVESETDYLKIAQLYYLQYGEYQYFNKLKKYFDVDLKPSRVHEKLFDILPSLIVTTNWDNLLEQTAFNEGLTYDVITNDVDLVKSRYFHKIIKMHGDFQHHNIVFKEDDYLKYSEGFPLIENYLKSILSTYVVVFIGYSYSDVDLKLITKWIETKSEITPPKFLFSINFNNAEANYLRNHGIQLLVPNNIESYSVSNILVQFLEMISQKDELSRYKKIIEKELLTQNEEYLLISFFYNKIKVLDELDSIFPKQIIDFFSDIRIKFHVNCYGLYFVTEVNRGMESLDLVKKYYLKIEGIIKNNKDFDNVVARVLKKIFYIFIKANVVFIQFKYKEDEGNIVDIRDYLGRGELIGEKNYLEFETKGEANNLIISEDYELLSIISRNRIRENIKDRYYIKLAINSFNNDISNLNLMLNSNKSSNRDSLLGSVYDNENYYVKKFKDYFDFYDLTNKVEYSFINDFLNFKVLDNVYFFVSQRVNKNLEMLDNFINGGATFDVDENEADLLIKSYLDFIYKNNIAMDNYSKVESLFTLYVNFKIKFIMKFHSNKNNIDNLFEKVWVSKGLSKEDLYILLNFSKKKDVLFFLNSLMEILNNNDIKLSDFFEEDINIITYLNNCFNNLLCKSESPIIENQLCNLILLSSLADWSESNNLVELLTNIFQKYKSYPIVDSIGLFVLFNSKYIGSKKINFNYFIDVFLNEIMRGSVNPSLNVIMSYSHFNNLFLYMADYKNYDSGSIIAEFLYFMESPANETKKNLFILNLLPLLLSVTIDYYEKNIYEYINVLLSQEVDDIKFEFFILCLLYVGDFVVKLESNILNKYIKELEIHLSGSNLFKNKYKLDRIVLSLARRTEKEYKLFKKLKKNLKLSEN